MHHILHVFDHKVYTQWGIICVWSPDDDIDLNNLPDDELELYFNKLVPPAMQRGRVEGQEIPATVRFPICSLHP